MKDPFIEYIEHDGTVTFYLSVLVMTLYHFAGYLYKFIKPSDIDSWLRTAMVLTLVHIIIYIVRRLLKDADLREFYK